MTDPTVAYVSESTEAARLYRDELLSIEMVANQLNRPSAEVSRMLDFQGVKRRGRKEAIEARALRNAQASVKKGSAETGEEPVRRTPLARSEPPPQAPWADRAEAKAMRDTAMRLLILADKIDP